MPIYLTEHELQSFREQLSEKFEHRADSTMDLLDALCSNNQAPSVVQLSLNPLFRAAYGNHQFLTPLQAHKNLVIIARSCTRSGTTSTLGAQS
jgi:hypothetical protein